MASSVISIPAGQTSVQHRVMLQYSTPNSFLISHAVFGVERVHLVLGEAHKVARAGELIEQFVISKHVAGVDAEETLDAFTEMLDAVGLHLVEFPVHGFGSVDGGDSLSHVVVPTHVGHQVLDVREGLHGSNFNGLAAGVSATTSLMRVMHIKRGVR